MELRTNKDGTHTMNWGNTNREEFNQKVIDTLVNLLGHQNGCTYKITGVTKKEDKNNHQAISAPVPKDKTA